MKPINKTRYALLGMLIEGPKTGYEIKAFINRSTAYFWRESDSTIYPMLKVLAAEGKVHSTVVYIGKKKKEVFSITDSGQTEFQTWLKEPTRPEIPRNDFLLKLFFITDQEQMVLLLNERLERNKKTLIEFKKIEERLVNLSDSSRKLFRLKSLRYGIALLTLEIQWLKEQ